MGLFRRHRSNKNELHYSKEETPAEEVPVKTLTVVILEFPPNFMDSSTTATRHPTILFQHETDSIVSDVSNCSCRAMFGQRRPDGCQFCAEMKESMRSATTAPTPSTSSIAPTEQQQQQQQQQLLHVAMEEDPTFSMSESSISQGSSTMFQNNQQHKVPPAISLLSKLVRTPSRRKHRPVVMASPAKSIPPVVVELPEITESPAFQNDDDKAGSSLFGNLRASRRGKDLSLDHELA